MEENQFNYTFSSGNQYDPNYRPAAPKPKKEKKGFGGVIAICIIFSLIAGLAGGFAGTFFGAKMSSGGSGGILGIGDGNTVIYRDVTLREKDARSMSIGEIADNTKDCVVEITTENVATGSFMMQYVSEGAGSGVIISENGYIATNYHVIETATAISVRTSDGTSYEAKIVGGDERTDLAVLKIEATGLKAAVYGDFSTCKVGDTVVAIGNPLGQLGGTVTDGIISALDREMTIDGNIMTLLQTNTAVNPGNSGGGLFNTNGQLIGIVNAKSSGEDVEGLGFAIPIDIAQDVIEDLIEVGYVTGRVETGIEVIEISDFQTAMYYRVSEAGVYVYSIATDSKADKAGFEPGDRIVSIDGVKIATEDEYNDIIDKHIIGDILEVVVVRQNREHNLSLELYEFTPTLGDIVNF